MALVQDKTVAPIRVATRRKLLQYLPHGAVVAEIGVQRGKFARQIYRRTKPRELHLIDCWQHQDDQQYCPDTANVSDGQHNANLQRTQQRLRHGIRRQRVHLHRGYSVPTLATFPDHYFDWVYVDANHTYEGALADLEACLPKVRTDGVIAGHDFIDTPYWQAMNFGVVAAVQDFCQRYGWEVVFETCEVGNEKNRRGNPSFAIRPAGLGAPQTQRRRWWSTDGRAAA